MWWIGFLKGKLEKIIIKVLAKSEQNKRNSVLKVDKKIERGFKQRSILNQKNHLD